MHSSLHSEKPALFGKGAPTNKCEHVNSVWKLRHGILFLYYLHMVTQNLNNRMMCDSSSKACKK